MRKRVQNRISYYSSIHGAIMSQYVCPQCGSQYFKVKTDEGSSVITLDPGYKVNRIHDENGLSESQLAETVKISCGACSWNGEVRGLQLSDLEI